MSSDAAVKDRLGLHSTLATSLSDLMATDCPRREAEPPSVNSILEGLPREELDLLKPHLQRVPLHRGQILLDVADGIDSLCFPLSGMICLSAVMADGRTVVLATTGRDGFLGVPAVLGDEEAPLRAVVLIEGTALKLGRAHLSRSLLVLPKFAVTLRRYCSSYLAQIVQIGACHALHSVQQRVAFWLLLARDRSDSDSLPLSHESLSELLGCRRPSVTESLSLLESAGFIHGGRRQIIINDRAGLLGQTCECYAVLRSRVICG